MWPVHLPATGNPHRAAALLAWAIVLIGTAAPAAAQSTITVEAGWENKIRPGRWTPVFVTVSDPSPRNVILELYAPHDRHMASRVRQQVVAQPNPTTYILYAPVSYSLDETVVTVRSGQPPHRRLNEKFLEEQDEPFGYAYQAERYVRTAEIFIGISGQRSTVRLLQGQLEQAQTRTGYLPPQRLPAAAVGYDALDLLLLNQPDLTGVGQQAISIDQQRAITDWVRAGGVLLIVPGAEPVPTAGPIAELLPAEVGASIEIPLTAEAREAAGLPDRFTQLTARQMTTRHNAEALPLIPETDAVALIRQYGLGHVVLLSFDASGLMFEDNERAHAFWRPLLSRFATLPDPQQAETTRWYSMEDQRKVNAVQHTMDLVGNVPGVGQFHFSYIAFVLVGLMFLVGPVDWFILKWLGRQPWTWITTFGWIGLVTAGAVALGSMMRSGDLHYRSVLIIDQADDMTVAETGLIGIYSPQSRTYSLQADDGWWRPPTADGYWTRGGMRTELPFYQDIEGNTPQDLRINIWNLRFLELENTLRLPPRMDAQLAVDQGRLTGRITNLGEHALEHLIIRTANGNFRIDSPPLEPGATLEVSAGVDESLTFDTVPHPHTYGPYAPVPQTPAMYQSQYALIADLAIRRSYTVERLLQQQDTAVIYAQTGQTPALAELRTGVPIEQHWQIIRAVVALNRSE
jgi:hypothetical protein